MAVNQDLDQLIAQTKREITATDRLGLRRSFPKLPELLREGEHYAHLAKGSYTGRIGLIAVTERRVIFVDEGMVYGGNNADFPYEKITAVETSKRLIHGAIKIHAASAIAVFSAVFPKRRAEEIAAYIRQRVGSAHQSPPPPTATPSASTAPDVMTQLKQLGELRDAGVLTKQEFDAKKAELLARL